MIEATIFIIGLVSFSFGISYFYVYGLDHFFEKIGAV